MSDQRGGDVDIAARRLGVGADLVRRIDQRLRDLAVETIWVLPVKRTFSVADFSVVDMAKSFPEVVNRIRLNRVRLIYFTGPDLVKHFRFNRIRFINLRHHKRWRFP
jgi:hypothetical protein